MPRNGGNTRHPNSATPSEQQAHQGLLLHSFIRIYRFLLFIWVWISFIPLVFLVRLAGVNFDRTMIFHAYPVLSRYIARLAFSLGQRGYVLSLKKILSAYSPSYSFIFFTQKIILQLNTSFTLLFLYHYTVNGYETKHCNESWYNYQVPTQIKQIQVSTIQFPILLSQVIRTLQFHCNPNAICSPFPT